MLISRIERSMDIMLEAIDNGDVSLILEASQEFEDGLAKTKDTLDAFLKILQKYNNSKMFDETIDGLNSIKKELESINSKDIPKDFSWKSAASLRGNLTGEGDQTAVLTKSAAAFDSYYNGTKDAIIAIAEGLEQLKEIFSVGSKGIYLRKEFLPATEKQPEKHIFLWDLTQAATSEEFANILAVGRTKGEEWKEEFKEQIDKIAEANSQGAPASTSPAETTSTEQPEGTGEPDPEDGQAGNEQVDEKTADARSKFLEGLNKAQDVLKNIIKNSVNKLTNAQPNPELEKSTQKHGFLQSLFKKSNPYKIDESKAMSIVHALAGQSLLEMNGLIKELVALSGNADVTVQAAVKATEAEASKEPDKKEADLASRIRKFANDEAVAAQIMVVLEGLAGEGSLIDLSKISKEDLKEPFMDKNIFNNDEEKFEAFIQQFKIKSNSKQGVDNAQNVIDVITQVFTEEKAAQDASDTYQIPTVDGFIIKIIDKWFTDKLDELQKETIGPIDKDDSPIGELKKEIAATDQSEKLQSVADTWFSKHKIDDNNSNLGNPDRSSPEEIKKLVGEIENIRTRFDEEIAATDSDVTIDKLLTKWKIPKDKANTIIDAMKNENMLKDDGSFNDELAMDESTWQTFVDNKLTALGKTAYHDEIKRALGLNESKRIFNRWGVLAGIIKG